MTLPTDFTVCPRCANGLPTCTDSKLDGTKFSHAETCATYNWGKLCPVCWRELNESFDDYLRRSQQ